MERRGHRDLPALKALPDHKDHRDRWVRKGLLVRRESRGRKGLLVRRESPGPKAIREPLVHRESQGRKDRLARRELLDQRATPVRQVHKELLELPAIQVRLVRRARRDQWGRVVRKTGAPLSLPRWLLGRSPRSLPTTRLP